MNYLFTNGIRACLSTVSIFSFLLCFSQVSLAENDFNFIKSTPVGSWAISENTTTDKKGKKTLLVVKQSLVGKDIYEGTLHYWIEMEMQSYKLKKDKRKKTGKTMIMKLLVNLDTFANDPENIMGNLNKYAKTIIMQTGDQDPMKMENTGAMAQGMMQAAGTQIEYSYNVTGTKKASVPAGQLNCTVMQGSGSTQVKIMFRKMKIESEIESCFSNKIPFGMVYSNSDILTNGKPSKSENVLIEYGTSGAKTAITKEPVEMPKIPKMF